MRSRLEREEEFERTHIDLGEGDYIHIDGRSIELVSETSASDETMRSVENVPTQMVMHHARQPSHNAQATVTTPMALPRSFPRNAESRAPRAMDHTRHKPAQRTRREPQGLSAQTMVSWQETLLKDNKNKLALSALSTANPETVLASPAAHTPEPHVFNVRIPLEGGPITDQGSSGRCWLFASTNIFRIALMHRHNLDSLELSQSYLYFWDKLEKANWFLEQIVDTANEELGGRMVQTLLGEVVSDGGQWDMVHNLVQKYGLVPQSLYPDSWNARNSRVLNGIVTTRLREAALALRRIALDSTKSDADIAAEKERTMQDILRVLTLTLGKPPSPDEKFTWSFLDKEGAAHELTCSPKCLARNIYSPSPHITTASIASMISLVHDPRHPPLTPLTVSRLGNVVGGRGVTYVNVPMQTLKSACVSMLRAGLPVFFGCDVGKFSSSSAGIMDLRLVDYEVGLDVSMLGMNKADRLLTGESAMTHAMVLTGVHVDSKTGETVRWRVQNSWGEKAGVKGWFVMSDAWMDEFVYQAVVDPKFVGQEVRDVLGKEPVVLPLWDPMGSLA